MAITKKCSLLLRVLLAGFFSLPAPLFAESSGTPPLKPEEEKKAVNETAKALAKGPTCDQKLLDELALHVEGIRCITYFEHSCLGTFALINGSIGGSLGLTKLVVNEWMDSVNKDILKTREAIERQQRLGKTSTQFDTKYQKYKEADTRSINGKVYNADQLRARMTQTLEKLSKDDAYVRTLAAKSQKLLKLSSVNRNIFLRRLPVGAMVGGVTLGALGLIMNATPAGDKCNDNGIPYIDYRPTEDGKGCEPSFSLTGPKLRSFFHGLNRTQQENILINNPAVCEYYNLLNEALKGQLVTELQILNQVKFEKMPTCEVGKRGVSYEFNVPNEKPLAVSARLDTETKKVRRIDLSDPSDVNNVNGMGVMYQDNQDGSRPYKVEINQAYSLNRANVPLERKEIPFENFLMMARNEPKYNRGVKALNVSQFWTPMVASCCVEDKPEACWNKNLPGLAEAQTEIKKQQLKKPSQDPATLIKPVSDDGRK